MLVNRAQYEEKIDPEKILGWLMPYVGHEHLMDIKKAPSLEKWLAIAPDIYVVVSMLQSVLLRAAEQKMFASYGDEDEKITPWNELTEEQKISEAPIRKAYMQGMRRGRDSAMVEMANRITAAAREQLDRYRLENPEYDPALVVDEPRDDV